MGFFHKLFGIHEHNTYYLEDVLSQEEIDANHNRIRSMLLGTHRKGIKNVLAYMEKYKFYTLPSSIHHHHNWYGGLAEHVLSVYESAKDLAPDIDDDSLVIACLLHDICKADTMKFDKDGGVTRTHGKGPGRGRRSIKILTNCKLELLDEERRAIRWHMGGNNASDKEFEDAEQAKTEQLWRAVYTANREDSFR